MTTDTIAAIATPPGQGGISIVRISGPEAERILQEIFAPASGKTSPRKFGSKSETAAWRRHS